MTARAVVAATVIAALAGVRGASADGAGSGSSAAIAAIAVADDVRRSTIVGVGGQVYDGDGRGAWVRTAAGGVGDDLAVAVRAGTTVIAGAADAATAHAPPFRERAGVWEIVPIALHAHAVVARGTRAVAAAGKQVFALDRAGAPAALPDAPAVVLAIGATAGGVAIATDHGVARLDGTRWRAIEMSGSAGPRGAAGGQRGDAIDGAPSSVVGFASDRWAITATGVFDVTARAAVAWPAGFVAGAVAADAAGDVVAAAAAPASSGDLAVVVIRAGSTRVDRDAVPAAVLAGAAGSGAASSPAAVAAVAIDRDGRVLVALRDGRIALRDNGHAGSGAAAWTATGVRDSLPADRPGSPPAASH
nr:hypothetical protein [Kofleriaceae bacterium]